jgi:hypothetical protein
MGLFYWNCYSQKKWESKFSHNFIDGADAPIPPSSHLKITIFMGNPKEKQAVAPGVSLPIMLPPYRSGTPQ